MPTDKQQAILDFIGSYLGEYGYPPTVREIASATGVKSTSTVFGHLERLEKKGLIKRDASKPRAIKIIK
jgi:repressor LexA